LQEGAAVTVATGSPAPAIPVGATGMRPGSGLDEAGDGCAGLGDLLVGDRAALGGGLRDAVLQVLVEQAEGDGFQGFRGGGDLGEHVDAVLVGLDHLRDAADLAFDPPQALEIGVLVLGVAVHPSSSGPPEILCPPIGRSRRSRRRLYTAPGTDEYRTPPTGIEEGWSWPSSVRCWWCSPSAQAWSWPGTGWRPRWR